MISPFLLGALIIAPNNSMGGPKPTKSEEIALYSSNKNESELQLNHADAIPVHSVPSYSPEIQYIQGVRSSSGRKGIFLRVYIFAFL